MILDQRHMYGGRTPAEVRARWERFVAGANEARLDRGLEPIRLTNTGRRVRPVVNHGRWVARCECGGGMGCWDENPVAACLDCGNVYAVAWPDSAVRAVAERILLARTNPAARNWDPTTESVDRLNTENVLLEGVI